MSELKFSRVNNEKYNTVSINIENALIPIKKGGLSNYGYVKN